MKTNHRRHFKDSKSPRRYAGSPMGSTVRKSGLADTSIVATWGGDNANGHRGYAKARKGAKKFVNTRIRFHENSALRQQAFRMPQQEGDPDTEADTVDAGAGDPQACADGAGSLAPAPLSARRPRTET